MIKPSKQTKGKKLADDIVRLKRTNKSLKLVVVCMVIITLVALGMFAIGFKSNDNNAVQGASVSEATIVERVSLSELKSDVYPKFICACCGNTIDVCSCGMAKGMKEYIDSLADEGLSKEGIIIEAVKKFGLGTLADRGLQEDIRQQLVESAPEDRPKIVIEPAVYDFGDVSQANGIANTILSVRNDGNRDLVINKITSSCGCTTATLIVNGVEGPRFGMHNNPTDWSATIAPGQTAQLKIYYDPNMHKNLEGTVTRTLTVFSNDPIDFQKQVRIELNQVP